MIFFSLQPSHIRKKLPCQQYPPESTAYFQIPLPINRPSLLFLCRTDIPYLPEIYDIIDLFINKSFFSESYQSKWRESSDWTDWLTDWLSSFFGILSYCGSLFNILLATLEGIGMLYAVLHFTWWKSWENKKLNFGELVVSAKFEADLQKSLVVLAST